MANKIKAVLDTNVFLRIILSKKTQGVAAAIWQLLQAGQFQLVTSEALLKELYEILLVPDLAEKHCWSTPEIREYVDSIRYIAIVTPGATPIELPTLKKRDATDLPFLVTAIEGEATCIVTQDPDLLELRRYQEIVIEDPLNFLRRVRTAIK